MIAQPPPAGRTRLRLTALRPSRGFALLIVLWALVLLTLIGTQLTSAGRSEARLASNLRGAATAQADADGAVYAAIFAQLNPAQRHWPPDGTTQQEPLPGAVATLRISSDDGKFDINGISTDVLANLLKATGVDASQAAQLALDIVLWRFPSAATTERRRAYQQAGLGYAPPGAAFQSVSELALVIGMTPAILARLAPHVTIYHEGEPDPRVADPIVRSILSTSGTPQAPPPPSDQAGEVVIIDVTVHTAAGSTAARHAVVRIAPEAGRGGWSVLDWH